MTIIREIAIEAMIETLINWSNSEQESVSEDPWCIGYTSGQDHAKKLVKDIIEMLPQ